MAIEDAFLHDILAHPDDDAPRLIYADWLEEHNNPRGEFIRIQCVLACLDAEDPRRWPLEQRERELLQAHESEWLPRWNLSGEWRFRRGFLEEITLTPEEFLVSAHQLFDQTPLRHICLRSLVAWEGPDSPVTHVARSPLLSRLAGLGLILPLSRYDLQAFAESPHLEQLIQLRLSGYLDGNALLTWGQPPRRPHLRHLDLSDCMGISSLVLRSLVQTPHLAGLTHLNLAQTALTLDDVRSLVQSSGLTNLTELNLNGNRLTHEVVSVLAQSPLLSQLEALHLDANLLGDPGAVRIREWPALPRLSRLTLRDNHLFASGVAALAQSPALAELISLDLFRNISCDAGAEALASSRYGKHLRALNLRFNGVGDKGVRALARSTELSELTWLDLTANRITNKGANALLDSPYLRRLARLDLLRNDIAPAEVQKLRDRFGPYVFC
jgi:uncharacterized protein (TIGR02996 family)